MVWRGEQTESPLLRLEQNDLHALTFDVQLTAWWK